MQFWKKYSYEVAFGLFLIAFIGFKIKDIPVPYFWDELGVYVPGALRMKDAGTIGLMPACLEPLYSRGHPLLFLFFQASVFQIFGDGVVQGHSFSLLLAVLTLVVFYIFGRDVFGKRIALFASILLAVQPVYYSMSGLILPEMMLTLFTIPAIWALIRMRWLMYGIFASLALLTKESAIVIPPLAMFIVFLDGFRQKSIFSRTNNRRYMLAAIPLLVYCVFLVIQKLQNGWFFFPEHIGYISVGEGIFDRIWEIVRDVLLQQGRWLLGAFFLALIVLSKYLTGSSEKHLRTIVVCSFFVLGAIFFATLNFYLFRYMLYVIPFVVLLGTFGLFAIVNKLSRSWTVLMASVPLILAFVFALKHMYQREEFHDTSDMSYVHVVELKQEAIAWLEHQPWRDSVIEANFPLFQAMSESRYGYLSGNEFRIANTSNTAPRYGAFFHLDPNEPIFWNTKELNLVKRFSNNISNITIVEFK